VQQKRFLHSLRGMRGFMQKIIFGAANLNPTLRGFDPAQWTSPPEQSVKWADS